MQGWCLRFCFSASLPGESSAAGPRPTLWEEQCSQRYQVPCWREEGGCSLGSQERDFSGRLCWELWLQFSLSTPPPPLPSHCPGKRVLSSWAVHLLCVLERVLGEGGRKKIAPLCMVTVLSRCISPWPDSDLEIAEWASSCLHDGLHSRIQCRPELFFFDQ